MRRRKLADVRVVDGAGEEEQDDEIRSRYGAVLDFTFVLQLKPGWAPTGSKERGARSKSRVATSSSRRRRTLRFKLAFSVALLKRTPCVDSRSRDFRHVRPTFKLFSNTVVTFAIITTTSTTTEAIMATVSNRTDDKVIFEADDEKQQSM